MELGGNSGRLFNLGACPSEAGLAGTTPGQVKNSLIGAGLVFLSVIPVGDVLEGLGIVGRAAEDAGVTVYRGTSLTSELMAHSDTGLLMSDAARTGYFESGGSIAAARAEPRTIICRACEAQVRVLAVDTGQPLFASDRAERLRAHTLKAACPVCGEHLGVPVVEFIGE